MKNVLLLIFLVISLNAYTQQGVKITDEKAGFVDRELKWIKDCDKFYKMHKGIDKNKVKCVNMEADGFRCKVQNGVINTNNCKYVETANGSCKELAEIAANNGYILVKCVDYANGGASGELVPLEVVRKKNNMRGKNIRGIIQKKN